MPHSTPEARRTYARERSRRVRSERVSEAILRLGGQCNRCGSQNDLEFDHIDPRGKDFDVARKAASVSKERFWSEVTKCQLLCRPCHTSKGFDDGTHQRRKHGTRSMYASHGCRCDPCTKAQRDYQRNWKRSRRGA